MAFIGDEHRKLVEAVKSSNLVEFFYERNVPVEIGIGFDPIIEKDIFVYPSKLVDKVYTLEFLNGIFDKLMLGDLKETVRKNFEIKDGNLFCGSLRFDEDVIYGQFSSYNGVPANPLMRRETTYISLFPTKKDARFFLNSAAGLETREIPLRKMRELFR